ncbi:ankyrin repeat domain-containing protein 26-like [Sarcophilus harrisii]|uniref:ankyrin repeat domain-containing protein 26-like n=1 Tax=Sarcophilus harrisii TaxID=9305 RepID=UPI001301B8F9|nr:ankyrin repeat domain-containing protein 26-like [Sarcophilus harrisii]
MLNSRLEGEKQNREKLQPQIHYPSCASSAVLEQEYQISEPNLLQEEAKWLLSKEELIDKIDILSIQLSKAEDEIYQIRNDLRMKTLLLEDTQRELKEVKDELKDLKNENYILKKKLNRSFLKQETLQGKLNEIQKTMKLPQKTLKDSKNTPVFISKGVQVPFQDTSMTFYADTAEKDPVLEERNKESVDDIRELENEKAKRKDTIRKLQQELKDSQKEKLMILQDILSYQTKFLYIKQKLQEKVDESTNNLQKSQEEDKQKLWYLKKRGDYIQKLKMERAPFEDAEKQQMDPTEKFPKHFLEFLIIQQAMENSVATSDDAVSELPSTSHWASPIGHTRRPNLNWDPVSRPTQQYLGN